MKRTTNPLKTGIIFAGLLLLWMAGTGVASAQPGRMSPKERAERLKDQLSLSDSQVVAVTKIYEESQQQMSKAFADSTADRQSRREMMTKIMGATDTRIDSLLTDEQKTKFAEIKKARQNRPGGRFRRGQ